MFIILSVLYPISAFAQIYSNSTPTHSDSLRGFLSENRQSFDVKFYELDITVDTVYRSILGYVDIYFEIINDIDSLQLDLFKNLEITSVQSSTGDELLFSRDENTFYVKFSSKYKTGVFDKIRVQYYGNPRIAPMAPWDGGFVWTYDDNGDLWISTAVQGLGASAWYPCKDHQSDKPDSVLIRVSVPSGLQNISNGRLRSVKEYQGSTTFEWYVSNPINTYNVCLNIGQFVHFNDYLISYDGDTLTLDYYVKDYNLEEAKEQFGQVETMMKCFESKFGKYPFYEDGYKIIETPFAGMEHQSAIAYGNNYKNGYRGISVSEYGKQFDYIIVHESAHEWWGNNITSNDIADMWIHEGFGTYAEAVYVECVFGYDAALTYINDHVQQVTNISPILGKFGLNKRGSVDMYKKGMLMLNTLRHVIDNDKLWWEILYELNKVFRHSSVDGTEIIGFINEKTGMNLNDFFRQYLEFTSLPDLSIKFDKSGDNTVIKYHWNTDTETFSIPVRLIVGNETMKIFPSKAEEEVIIYNTSPDDIKVDTARFFITVNGVIE
ncbi:MAG: M1 family metallopeptidase [Ignavibacteria bacterium]